MTDDPEKRKYPRVSPGVNFGVMVQHVDKKDREYYKGIIKDVSLGGMFIDTDHLPPKGSMVVIQFRSNKEGDERPVIAKGLVCWTQKWKRPHGMGIDFIEFEGLGNTPFEEWFKNHFQSQ